MEEKFGLIEDIENVVEISSIESEENSKIKFTIGSLSELMTNSYKLGQSYEKFVELLDVETTSPLELEVELLNIEYAAKALRGIYSSLKKSDD